MMSQQLSKSTRDPCVHEANHSVDHCSHRLNGDRCIHGECAHADDCISLCPLCYSGEFSSISFSFTLNRSTNTCSFVPLRRFKCQTNGVGQYLAAMRTFNQISLGFLTANSTSDRVHPSIDTHTSVFIVDFSEHCVALIVLMCLLEFSLAHPVGKVLHQITAMSNARSCSPR